MKQRILKTSNPDIDRLMKQLLNNNIGFLSPKSSKSFGRHKVIRHLREQDLIYIAHDRKKRKDIVYCPTLKIKKNGKGYIFL